MPFNKSSSRGSKTVGNRRGGSVGGRPRAIGSRRLSACHARPACRHISSSCCAAIPVVREPTCIIRPARVGEVGAMSESLVVGGALQTERQTDGTRNLLRELQVCTGRHCITVPSQFVTDFSSIPALLHWVVRWSRVDVAGVVHDFLYAHGTLSRWKADGVCFEVARSGKHRASLLQAVACWSALCLFGWYIWIRPANRRGRAASRSGVGLAWQSQVIDLAILPG